MAEDIGRITPAAAPRGAAAIACSLREAREYTLAMYSHLTEPEQRFPRIATVNPPRWEVGHVGWFQEFWCRRYRPDDPRGAASRPHLPDADRWFDSSNVAHDTRWDLPLPGWESIRAYLSVTLDDTLAALSRASDRETYFFELALYHEDMHAEAMLMTLHALGLRAPSCAPPRAMAVAQLELGDVDLPACRFRLGAERGEEGQRFVFDNEKHAHDVEVSAFSIARQCVTQEAFAAFVEDGGYARPELWSEEGRVWLGTSRRAAPADWLPTPQGWIAKRFDTLGPIDAHRPVEHVNAFEAEAWARWAGRRLPSEAEWESAAACGLLATPGAVWEWTSTPFRPYPGFAADPYADYSVPWFGDHRVLRGGSWATKPRLAHPRFRNFYRPSRHDAFAGFRTCAIR